MKLINRMKVFEQKYVFLRWATGAEYGKITYVGDDYVEFNIIDVDTMEYRETVIINSQLILEAVLVVQIFRESLQKYLPLCLMLVVYRFI